MAGALLDEVTEFGFAKINLCLDVTGKRGDGYHDLRTVMQTVDLRDEVTLKIVHKPNYLKLVCDAAFLPTDGRNLAFAAARFMLDEYGITDGVFINLKKRIPIAAGLAGGSADCAAVIRGVSRLFGLPLAEADMERLGRRFGADVPFCVSGGTQLAEGVGDVLTKLPPPPVFYAALAKPRVSVSTASVFRRFVMGGAADVDGVLAAIRRGDLDAVCAAMGNSLESVTCGEYPVINEIKETLTEHGALGALMSGSGPTAFGVFAERRAAVLAAHAVRRRFPDVRELCVAKCFN